MDRIEKQLKEALLPLNVLTVCTGNICRSPLAAALLQNEVGEPEISGIKVSSAGIQAALDLPPTEYMVEYAFESGVDYSDHEARQLAVDMVEQYDVILAAEPLHRNWIINLAPESESRVMLLGELIGIESILDPYGSTHEVYHETSVTIRRAVNAWKPVLGKTISDAGWRADLNIEPPGSRDDRTG